MTYNEILGRSEMRAPTASPMEKFHRWWPKGQPRGISPTNIDAMVHNSKGDRLLIIEFKPMSTRKTGLSNGQKMTLQALARRKATEVYLVLCDADPEGNDALPDNHRAYIFPVMGRAPLNPKVDSPVGTTIGALRQIVSKFLES